jgi:hypothetical protein
MSKWLGVRSMRTIEPENRAAFGSLFSSTTLD